MATIEHKGIVYEEVDILSSSEVIDLEKINQIKSDFEKEKCVENACEVAKVLNIKCVEGFVICMVTNGSEIDDKVIRHCWNKIDDKYFDVTKDFVWPEFNFIAQKLSYFPIGEYEHSDYSFENGKLFNSEAVQIAKELDEIWKKNIEEEEE